MLDVFRRHCRCGAGTRDGTETCFALSAALPVSAGSQAEDNPAVGITPDMASEAVMHAGKKTLITRNQDQNNTVNPAFAKTSRKCPPFCIQPGVLAPGVETIAELEVLDYLSKTGAGDEFILWLIRVHRTGLQMAPSRVQLSYHERL